MLRLARFAALAFTSALPAWAETRGFDALVVAPDQTVDGLPLATYANLWWQWAFSMAEAESPVLDEVGTFCSVNQAGPIWFLAGGYGSSRIDRVCEVPAGRHLFFPIINVIQVLYPATDADCPALQAEAATFGARIAATDLTALPFAPMGQAGRRIAEWEYSAALSSAQTIAIYRELL